MGSGLSTRERTRTRPSVDIVRGIEEDLAEILRGISLPRRAPAAAGRGSVAYDTAKRIFDIVAAALAITLTSPLMAVIALAIRLESKGPAFFGHIRLGKDGNRFRCLKFRSMKPGAQSNLRENDELWRCYVENDYKIPLDQDPRVTRVGRFLRKSSLDELPQLFNVLGGTMSLVGPRPIVDDEIRWYGDRSEQFLSVRPGITGAWQVQGRSRISYPERTEVELQAIRDQSFLSDLKILLKSIPAVITARGSL